MSPRPMLTLEKSNIIIIIIQCLLTSIVPFESHQHCCSFNRNCLFSLVGLKIFRLSLIFYGLSLFSQFSYFNHSYFKFIITSNHDPCLTLVPEFSLGLFLLIYIFVIENIFLQLCLSSFCLCAGCSNSYRGS